MGVNDCDDLLLNGQILEQKVEYWMEKYDRDVEQKQHELDVLKVCGATVLLFLI